MVIYAKYSLTNFNVINNKSFIAVFPLFSYCDRPPKCHNKEAIYKSAIILQITSYSPLQTRDPSEHRSFTETHKPVSAIGLETSVCFLPSLLRSPVPLLLFLHRTLSGRRGWRVDTRQGTEEGNRGQTWWRGGHLL